MAVAERGEDGWAPQPPDVSELRPEPASERSRRVGKDHLLAVLLAVACGLVAAGAWMVDPAAGLIGAGLLLAAWSAVVLMEVP